MIEEFTLPKYTFENPPPEERCAAIRFNCCHPECDYRFPEDDRETPICPECNTGRKICGSYPAKGRTRCKFHGGAVPMGIANNLYRGKGVSKSLPARMLEFYHLARQDPNIISMNDDIALLLTRREDLLGKVDEHPSAKLWQVLGKKWQKYVNANRLANEINSRRTKERALELFYELEDCIVKGVNDAQAWQEIYDVQERLRRLKKSEIDRRKVAESVITENQFKTMLGYIINSIKTRTNDYPDIQSDILSDITKLNM